MKRIGFILVLTGLISLIWAGWRSEVIATFPGQYLYSITIGVGRNDDTVRLYVVTSDTASYPALPRFRTVKELSYSNGHWYVTPVCSLVPIKVNVNLGLTLADGRNDGINRLYIPDCDSSLWEFTFSDGKWKGNPILKTVCPASILGAMARNDGVIRLYCGIRPGTPSETLIEVSWAGDYWIIDTLPGNSWIAWMAGCGRNDDTMRLYVGDEYGALEELTFRDGEWKSSSILPMDGHVMGDARNDSIIRIYGWGYSNMTGSTILEYTYKDKKWQEEIVDSEIEGGGLVASIGDGKNCERNQLYWARTDGIDIYEWKDGYWRHSYIQLDTLLRGSSLRFLSSLETNLSLGVVIGKLRNDDTNRVYVIIGGNKLVELTWIGEGIEEKPYLSERINSLFIYPNPFSNTASIYWQVAQKEEPVRLRIYNLTGQRIKTFLKDRGLKPGIYRVLWDGKDDKEILLPNGIYFVELENGNKRYIKKIVLHRKEER